MRSLTRFATAFVLSLPLFTGAHAQTTAAPAPATPPPPATSPAAPPAEVTPAPPALTARPIAPQTHHRMSLAQRFDAANTTHDGHLTLAQAKASNMSVVVKNFDQMDTSKKGYVTIDDIHTYYRSRHRTPAKEPSSAISG